MLTRRDYDLRSRELTGDQLRVYRALRWGSARKADVIAYECDFERRSTSPHVRAVVLELIERGFPVVSSARGFWLTESREEVEGYAESLRSRIAGVATRIKRLGEIAQEGEQRESEFVQATMFGE